MKFLFFFITLYSLIQQISFCQIISGQIVDKATLEPLEYSTIRVVKGNIGTISLKNGEFELDISKSTKNDSIRFSYLGYETVTLAMNVLQPSRKELIKLTPVSFNLQEVIVNEKPKTIVIGNQRVGRNYTGWGDLKSLRGRIRGILVDVQDCPVKVKSMSFRLNHNDWDSVAFRLNISEVNDKHRGNSLLKKNIFVTTGKKHKWVRIDLNQENILICSKAIVSLEWVDAWGKTGEFSNLLTVSLGKNRGYTYKQELGEEYGQLTFGDSMPAIILEVYSN